VFHLPPKQNGITELNRQDLALKLRKGGELNGLLWRKKEEKM